MTTKTQPDLYALIETLEVVQRAAKAGLWDQTTWINSDPVGRGAVEWQERTFCGTAGCFAGWRAILDGAEVIFVEDDHIEADCYNESLAFPDGTKVHSCAIGGWAQERLGLTETQSSALFSAENSLGDLHAIVREIVVDTIDRDMAAVPVAV